MLKDKFNRSISYLRLSVTDRCNLRCLYCMPEKGLNFLSRSHILSYEEMLRMAEIFAGLGVNKIRITGGEPFVRKDLIHFIEKLVAVKGIDKVAITTNGVLTEAYLPQLKQFGVKDINLSLDSVDPQNFARITRRDELPKAMQCLDALHNMGFNTKINTVVMDGKNTHEIEKLCRLAEKRKIDVRFIEEMPFNGGSMGSTPQKVVWNERQIRDTFYTLFPDVVALENEKSSTTHHYFVPGFKGKLGIIPAYTRNICSGCNRIRLTAEGKLKTCLYDKGKLDFREMLRNGSSNEQIIDAIQKAVSLKLKDGFEAEKAAGKQDVRESMATIGG
ncbi:GTP 3',8-cyclase MoaA [bacterium]|nr:GTP 3',8-cyclase MoaA [bacterium]